MATYYVVVDGRPTNPLRSKHVIRVLSKGWNSMSGGWTDLEADGNEFRLRSYYRKPMLWKREAAAKKAMDGILSAYGRDFPASVLKIELEES